MTQQEIQAEIRTLEANNAAMVVQSTSVALAGAFAGGYLAHKRGKGILYKVGFAFLGYQLAGLPMNVLFAKKFAENIAKIDNLKAQLPPKPSLYEELQNQYSNQ